MMGWSDMVRASRCLAAVLLISACAAGGPPGTDQQQVIAQSAATVERLRTDENFQGRIATLLPKARGVLIVPELVKAGFLVGGEFGTGVLMVRDGSGQWSPPAFYTVSAGSVGLQAGLQGQEVMFILNSQKAVNSVVNTGVKLGADVSVAVATMGAGMEGSVTPNAADIVAFSRASGAFGGGALEGAVIRPRDSWNAAYYGRGVAARQVLGGEVPPMQGTDRLRSLLER